jgi:hypothetical protein
VERQLLTAIADQAEKPKTMGPELEIFPEQAKLIGLFSVH